MNTLLSPVLACPNCHYALVFSAHQLRCPHCDCSFAIKGDVPIFSGQEIETVGESHKSNSLGAEYENILSEGKDFVLHIGAGATTRRFPNCIELEHKIFRHTDVVGDAHHLPFRDDVFDRVFAFNVFEHLRDPKTAAGEILRVLKPGGSVAIHTAFLQPLHEEPTHFYNCTAYGAREWFSHFTVDRCEVSPNFSPAYMLGFFSATLLDALRAGKVALEEQEAIGQSSLADWARFWEGQTGAPRGFSTLQNLPFSQQQRVAAGFELHAHKRKPEES
jgi:SAM-dependent methyltransferase